MIIGCDARTVSGARELLWDGPRRDQYLVRRDVKAPLSVDTMVWPSLFDRGVGIGHATEVQARLLLDGQPISVPWDGREWSLWADLGEMDAALGRQIRPESLPFWRIAVGIAYGADDAAADGAGMAFLGFDIADDGFLSGLMNCGYDEEEQLSVRAEWADALNEHHLFADWDVADRFRAFSDRRVPEHRPFGVYSLWRID